MLGYVVHAERSFDGLTPVERQELGWPHAMTDNRDDR